MIEGLRHNIELLEQDLDDLGMRDCVVRIVIREGKLRYLTAEIGSGVIRPRSGKQQNCVKRTYKNDDCED